MLANYLKSIIKSPISNNDLSENGDELIDEELNEHFKIHNNIPILLPKESKQNSFNLDYIKHYEEDHKYFDYFSETPSPPQFDDEKRVHEMIISKIFASTKDILDVGCGGAWVAKHFTALGKNVVSFDISILNVEKALQTVPHPNHYGIVGDALNIPIKEASFDCIIASEIIEHVVDPKEFVSNLFSLLKPGGHLIITTPYNETLRMETCIHCNGQTPRNSHLHSFNEHILSSYNPLPGNRNFKFNLFGNKALIILRSYAITQYLSFNEWLIIDKIANSFANKPAHILAEYRK